MAVLLIESGAEIDALDDRGSTPLHVAAENFSLDVATMLIESGATTDWHVLSQYLTTGANTVIDEFKSDIWEFLPESDQG
mgnify:CR=1 FL=1